MQINDNFEIEKWRGIKNDVTKETAQGYLYIGFLKDVHLLNIHPNVIDAEPKLYKAGQKIGFFIHAKNKKQAILIFSLTYQVCK